MQLLKFHFFLGNDGLVRLLLSKGASVNASSSEGTPLHMAASHGKSAIVQVLLQNNADVSNLMFPIYRIIMLFMGTDIFP
jgi:ankyrin repeat protein